MHLLIYINYNKSKFNPFDLSNSMYLAHPVIKLLLIKIFISNTFVMQNQ